MIYRKLGQSGLNVSLICLGTMTWGEQNSEREAHAQLDLALERGLNFIDTAELYAVPPREETQGLTERYLGSWLAQRGGRDRIILATKVIGRSQGLKWIRNGGGLTREHINAAVESSLKRLNTDYIDLYQLHWPDRRVNNFGELDYTHEERHEAASLEHTLEALQALVKAGKIRHVGLSNETPWGTMRCLQLAQTQGLPRVQSIQNPYSLLNRSFEVGLAEVAIREQCGLLAYSPLAMGMLTGKYLKGQQPEGARLTRFKQMSRYTSAKAHAVSARYADVAERFGLTMTQMALAFVNQRSFVTSTIIGATNLEQLEENIASAELSLSQEVIDAINDIHRDVPNPCP